MSLGWSPGRAKGPRPGDGECEGGGLVLSEDSARTRRWNRARQKNQTRRPILESGKCTGHVCRDLKKRKMRDSRGIASVIDGSSRVPSSGPSAPFAVLPSLSRRSCTTCSIHSTLPLPRLLVPSCWRAAPAHEDIGFRSASRAECGGWQG
jgi:hypothetical protein